MAHPAINHTLFALGHGDLAEALGEFSEFVGPDDLLKLPVGRAMLAAPNVEEARESFVRFATAWDSGGFDTFLPPAAEKRQFPVRGPDAPHHPVGWVPYEERQDIYLYHAGRWFLWLADDHPQWHELTLTDSGLRRHPVTRIYGTSYETTCRLDLGQLAVWIMAEASVRVHWRGFGFSAHVHPGGTFHEPSIEITVHGVPEAEAASVATELDVIAEGHNWSNPCDPDDHRFRFISRMVPSGADDRRSPRPGQITIADDDDDDDE